MNHRIGYFRVSTHDQSIEAQRITIGGTFDQEFSDEGFSGGVPAKLRPGFKELLLKVRKGDTVCVQAVDRFGRDAMDVQNTVRHLIDQGVIVYVHGIGTIERGVNELVLAVLAQVAEIELQRIKERQKAGRAAARASLELTGKTHRGKDSLGRPFAGDPVKIREWRERTNASIRETAKYFKVSEGTVKRYCAMARELVIYPEIL